ncbi:MAG: hypothetical protein ACRCS9_06160, partial [Hyphomicrobium sp.]
MITFVTASEGSKANSMGTFKTTVFKRHQGGSVSILFAMVLTALVLVAGVAIDFGRGASIADRAQAALDAAALAATKTMLDTNASDAVIAAVAQSYFDSAMKSRAGWQTTLKPLDVKIDRAQGGVALSVKGSLSSTIGNLVGVNKLNLSMSSHTENAVKNIELGVMLDVSGSMIDNGKLGDLKDAVDGLIEELLDNKSDLQKVRIGFAPYSTSVNAGEYASKFKETPGNGKTKNTCVSERKGADAFTDEPPSNGKFFGGKPTQCPTSPIVPLTEDAATLRTNLNAFQANGATAGHLGIAWAWYLISPKWSAIWPSESQPEEHDPAKLI